MTKQREYKATKIRENMLAKFKLDKVVDKAKFGINYKVIAKDIGINYNSLMRWKNGIKVNFNSNNLDKIQAFLDKNLPEGLEWHEFEDFEECYHYALQHIYSDYKLVFPKRTQEQIESDKLFDELFVN